MEGLSQQLAQDCEMSESPTATPFHTRSGSPVHGLNVNHTIAEGDAAVAGIWSSLKSRRCSSQTIVSSVDGSAVVPTATKLIHLAFYFAFNLGLTLFNKAVMIKFPCPFLLTALHAGSAYIVFSLLYTANIATSNVSLNLVTVPFHQVIRATTPIFTILIYRIFLSSTYTPATYFSLVPVIIGVGLATYGDYYATTLGFFITLLGSFLAAIKTVATNRLQTAGLHFNALELLYRMSSLAFMWAISWACWNGELTAFQEYACNSGEFGIQALIILLSNGAIAFGLNVVSFSANKQVGALTMTVAGNIKQIMTILLAVAFWHLKVGLMNGFGITLTLLGGALYAYVELGTPKANGGIDRDLEGGKSEKI